MAANRSPHRSEQASRGFPYDSLREITNHSTGPSPVGLQLIPARIATMVTLDTNARQGQGAVTPTELWGELLYPLGRSELETIKSKQTNKG